MIAELLDTESQSHAILNNKIQINCPFIEKKKRNFLIH